jgi:hypothetical protein
MSWQITVKADTDMDVRRRSRGGEQQLFNHQTHHRGQLTTLLFQAGQDPGATDLFATLYEEAQSWRRGCSS